MPHDSERFERVSRRRYLAVVGATTVGSATLAGCAGDGGDGGATPTATAAEQEEEEELPEGVSQEEFERGPVPSVYREAVSQGNEQRDPDNLRAKADVNYMEAAAAVEQGLASEGNSCANCADFIPDQNGDGFGACAEVEGYIGAEDYCVIWEPLEGNDGDDEEAES
jgi:hypothetical protein